MKKWANPHEIFLRVYNRSGRESMPARRKGSCLVCLHKERKDIDKMLVAGDTTREIMDRYGVSQSTLHRHKPHVTRAIVKAEEKRDVSVGESLLNDMERIRFKLWRLCEQAEQQRDGAAPIVVLRELRATIESLDERFSRLKGAATREVVLNVVYDDV